MKVHAEEHAGKWIVTIAADGAPVASDRQANEVVAALFENDARLVLFEAGSLPGAFANLRTGVAGIVLQKLAQYGMQAAAVMDESVASQGRFGELMREMNRGSDFRTFPNRVQALAWLMRQSA